MEELIARTRFTERDLFVLLNGYDTGWMVCPPSVTDWGPPTEKQVDKWRRKLVRRFEKDRLVDSEANPCKELLDVIDPLRLPGLIVANEHYPMGPDEDDPRTAAVYVLPDGRATLAARGAGFFSGWFLWALHGEAEILEAVLALNGLGGSVSLTPQSVDRRIIIPSPNPDLDISNLALTGDTTSVIKYAEQFCFDPSDFLDLSHWWLEGEGKAIARKIRGGAAARKLVTAEGLIASKVFDSVLSSKNDPPFTVKYATHDLRGLRILEEDGFTLGKIDGNFRFRSSQLLPYFGVMGSLEYAPLPSDPPDWESQERHFEVHDLYTTKERLARTLLTVDEYPADGRAVTYEGDDIPLWSYDKMVAEGSKR